MAGEIAVERGGVLVSWGGGMDGRGDGRERGGGRGEGEEGAGAGAGLDLTYPRMVRQMLMRRSAPQPAMRKTPRGGTEGMGLVWFF